MRLRADLLLVLVALIWGLAFAAQRSAASSIGVWWFNGARFFLAALFLSPLLLRARPVLSRNELGIILAASIVLACASGLQQAGLRYTTAANAGFITSMYVVMVPLLSLLLFRQSMQITVWLSAGLAMAGAFLLSAGVENFSFAKGDLLEFGGAILWALHLILVDRIVRRNINILQFVVIQYCIVSVIQFSLGFLFEPFSVTSLVNAWVAIAYTGIVSVGLGYTLQAFAQRIAPPGDAAIILSMESVFAALGGFLILGEILSPVQLIGCMLILLAVIWSQMTRIVRLELA
jgi:drug/metabolite transporter (DMT)-like permease